MKPRNFPAKKLARQIRAQENRALTEAEFLRARNIRSKKKRG